MSSLGKRLKELRFSEKLTITEMSEIIGVSITSVCLWEKNERKPSKEKLEKYAECFDVSLDWLLSSKEDIDMFEKKAQNLRYSARNCKFNKDEREEYLRILNSVIRDFEFLKSRI